MPSAPPPSDWQESLKRAGFLLSVEGSQALRAQAQQQAALELLQARKLGAADSLLIDVLRDMIRTSVNQVLRDGLLEDPNSLSYSIDTVFSLAELDDWILCRSLRRYQQLIAHQIPFAVDIEGVAYQFKSCRASISENRILLRRCTDGALYVLVSDSCGSGFSLEGRQPEPWEPARMPAWPPAGPPVLRAGNPNFAHFLWNELDPLLHLARRARERGEPLPVVQDFDTVLDLARLPGVVRLSVEVLERRPSLHVGAMWVSRSARHRVLSCLGAPLASTRPPGQAPLVVLGVRGPGRRELIDEVTLLTGLIGRLLRRWPGLRVALDGFTVQQNLNQNPAASLRAGAIGDRVAQIQAAFPPGRVGSLHGLSFAAYLSHVAEATVYVTHEGTIQHKIGWLYPEIPGICLVAGPHARAIAEWHRIQCEDATTMAILPPGLLLHSEEGSAGSRSVDQRDLPFQTRDPIAAIRAIEELLAIHLEDTTSDHPPEPTDLVSAVWQSIDPLSALTALERRLLASAGRSREALFELCKAVCLTHHPEMLAAALDHLRVLPDDDLWVRLYRLRLAMIKGEEPEIRAKAEALQADAGQLDPDNRQLLASLLVPRIDRESLARLLPELSQAELAVLGFGETDPPSAAGAAVQLLEQAGRDSGESARAWSLYSRLGPSLRRPFQPWASPEVADPARVDRLVEAIATARQEGRGFGLIRLGDGEGWFLAGHSADLEGATRNGALVEAELASRGGQLSGEVYAALQDRFRLALLRADVVGIPDLWQCLCGPEHALKVAAYLGTAGGADLWPGGWHLHLQLLLRGSFQRPPFDRIDAVIGPALPPNLRGSDTAFVPLPGEDPHWSGTDRPQAHYPRVYERVLGWIEGHVRPGQLVLVGGGLLGKIYVDAIRSRGGVGIDVGSVIDLTCGHTGHRGEHRRHPYLGPLAAAAFQPQR